MPIAPEKGRCTRMGRGSGGERSNQQPTVFHLPQVRQTRHAHTRRRQGRIRKDHLCSRLSSSKFNVRRLVRIRIVQIRQLGLSPKLIVVHTCISKIDSPQTNG